MTITYSNICPFKSSHAYRTEKADIRQINSVKVASPIYLISSEGILCFRSWGQIYM